MTDPAVPEPFSQPPPPWLDRVSRMRSTLLALPRAAVAAGVAALVVVVLVALFARRSGPPPPIVLPRADAPATADGPPTGAPSDPAGGAETVTVHAAGAVAKPGVYVVPGRARVADVLAAAGGTVADANVDQLNLAAKVTDAQRIYVPRRGEVAAPAPTDSPAGGSPAGAGGASGPAEPVDLNTADATQLDVLPGVGPATAKAIVDHRTAHGRFRSVTDLLSVRGIGPAKLEAIRPLVKV